MIDLVAHILTERSKTLKEMVFMTSVINLIDFAGNLSFILDMN